LVDALFSKTLAFGILAERLQELLSCFIIKSKKKHWFSCSNYIMNTDVDIACMCEKSFSVIIQRVT